MSTSDTLALITELDILYQSTLDRLEAHVRDVHIIDHALRRILDQGDSESAVLEWDIERAMSPRAAFRALALRLVEHMQSNVQREIALSPIDYDDLLIWPREISPANGTTVHHFLAKVQAARGFSLRQFWADLSNRVAPDRDPEAATDRAANDLAMAFTRQLTTDLIVPVNSRYGRHALPMEIMRQQGDSEWVLPGHTITMVTRANHALSTLLQLARENKVAAHIKECTTTFNAKIRERFRQYAPAEAYFAGDDLRIELTRDSVDYHMSDKLYSLTHNAIHRQDPHVAFLPSRRIAS